LLGLNDDAIGEVGVRAKPAQRVEDVVRADFERIERAGGGMVVGPKLELRDLARQVGRFDTSPAVGPVCAPPTAKSKP